MYADTYFGKTLVIVLTAFLVINMTTTALNNNALASTSPYDSGHDHGCDDAKISDPSDRYINQPEKGPSFHPDGL